VSFIGVAIVYNKERDKELFHFEYGKLSGRITITYNMDNFRNKAEFDRALKSLCTEAMPDLLGTEYKAKSD